MNHNSTSVFLQQVSGSLGHVFGELHKVLSVLQRQQRQDPAVPIHALLVLPQAHLQAAALPQVAHVGGVVLDGCGNRTGLKPGFILLQRCFRFSDSMAGETLIPLMYI